MLGYIFALFSALMWGTNNVFVKKVSGYNPVFFQFLISLGVLLAGLIISIINQSFEFTWWGILNGLMWTVGGITLIYAINLIGLARTMPILQGTIIPVSFIAGVLIFNENVESWVAAISSLLLFGIGIYLLTSEKVGSEKKESFWLGIFLSAGAGILFGFYGVPFEFSGFAPDQYIFSVSIGIFLSSLVAYLIRFSTPQFKYLIPAMSSGFMWNLGNYSSFFAISILGLTLGYPLTQLAIFVNVMWGVLYFKEVKTKDRLIKIVFGSICLFSAAILLSLA